MSNITNSCDIKGESGLHIPLGLHVFAGIGMFVVILLAVVGNLLVILSFIQDKQLRKPYNMYILSLAVCDLFIGSISMPFYAHYTLNNWIWIFGKTFCTVWSVNDYCFCLEVIFLIVLLSHDRVLLVTNGPKYVIKETKFRVGIKITVSFIVSFSVYGSCIIGWEHWRGYSIVDPTDCDIEFYDNFYFSIAIAIFELTLPVATVSVLNFIVFRKIHKRIKVQGISNNYRRNKNSELQEEVADDSSTKSDRAEKFRRYQIQKSVRQDKKTAKFLAILVITFLLMWGPYTIIQLLNNICEDCINRHVEEFFVWFLWTKSSVNPFLYALQNTRFRMNIFRLLPCLNLFFKRNNRVAVDDN